MNIFRISLFYAHIFLSITNIIIIKFSIFLRTLKCTLSATIFQQLSLLEMKRKY